MNRLPYQFVLLRYQHSATAGELANIGVVMWLPSERTLLFELPIRYRRLSNFLGDFDGSAYRITLRRLDARFEAVAKGSEISGQLDFDEILSLLIPTCSNNFQWSPIMAGVSGDCQGRLHELAMEFLDKGGKPARQRRDEKEMVAAIEDKLERRGLATRVSSNVLVTGKNINHKFKYGWQNGVQQLLEPISLDYLHAGSMEDKANEWCGRLFDLAKGGQDFLVTGVVSSLDLDILRLQEEFNHSVAILQGAPKMRQVLMEEELDSFIPQILQEIENH